MHFTANAAQKVQRSLDFDGDEMNVSIDIEANLDLRCKRNTCEFNKVDDDGGDDD